MLNTVPIYDCFAEMENGKFVYSMLDEAIDKHIDIGSDMIVFHPTLTRELAHEVFQSSRIIKVTSRGGSQMYRYIIRYNKENPYYDHWDTICEKMAGTGVAIAIGLSLRSGSILDDMDNLITNPHFKWGFEKRPQGLCYCSPERRVAQAYFTCCR